MRLLHIYRDCLHEGGVPHLTRQLIEAQATQGDEVLVVAGKRESARNRLLFSNNSRVHYFEVANRLSSARALKGAVRAFDPHIAHISGLTIPSQQVWAHSLFRSVPLPYVVSPHGVLNPLGMNVRFGEKRNTWHRIVAKRLFRRFADRPLIERAAAIHAECQFEADLAIAFGATQVFALPIGIDDAWRNGLVAQSRQLHDPVTFLHLGRLDIHQKGLDLVLQAAAILAQSRSSRNWRIVLAGSTVGTSLRQIYEMIGNARLADHVEVREPVWQPQEKEALWREGDFFLSPFRYGGAPRATAEALGNGLPLLASRESNWGDWARTEGMGLLAELTPQSVARVMSDLITVSPDAFESMANRAFQFAEQHSWPRLAHAFSVEYGRVLARTHGTHSDR